MPNSIITKLHKVRYAAEKRELYIKMMDQLMNI